jgi:hypothetical protein
MISQLLSSRRGENIPFKLCGTNHDYKNWCEGKSFTKCGESVFLDRFNYFLDLWFYGYVIQSSCGQAESGKEVHIPGYGWFPQKRQTCFFYIWMILMLMIFEW